MNVEGTDDSDVKCADNSNGDLEIYVQIWDWVDTDMRTVTLAHTFMCRDKFLRKQSLVIVAFLAKFAKICTCQN